MIGPDASRYLHASAGTPVPRPFHLRWLLPAACGTEVKRWWAVWIASWPLLAVGMLTWRLAAHDGLQVAVAAALLLVALPGILGPAAVIPVGVDLPAAALGVWACALVEFGHPAQVAAGVLVSLAAGAVKESTPVFAALWVWSPWLLIGLLAPLVRHVLVKPGPDPLGPRFQAIADHPVKAALNAHRGNWRDARLMVAPWGVALAALYDVDWRLVVVLGVAYAQLLVATDSVRLYQHAAGPAMASTAAVTIPLGWLWLAVVVHVVWWWNVERI